jgi:hypothetical protein
VGLVGALRLALRRISVPWPQRVAVRLEPRRPRLTEAAVGPDNAFYFLRQLTDYERVPRDGPPPAPASEEAQAAGSSARSSPAGEESGPATALHEEQTRLFAEGYSPGAYPLHEQWLPLIGPALALCEQAAAARSSQVPTGTVPDEARPWLGPLKGVARAYAYRIEKQAYEGQWPGAVADVRVALATGRSASHGGCLTSRLVTIACDSIISSSLRRVACRDEVPHEVAAALLALLAEHEDQTDPVAETLRYELLTSPRAVDMALAQRIPRGSGCARLYQPVLRVLLASGSTSRALKDHLADCFSLLVQDAEQPYQPNPPGAQEVECFIRGTACQRFLYQALTGDDPLGRVLDLTWLSLLCRARAFEAEATATLRATALTLALCDWRRVHGQPPPRLDDLVPAYFATLPADPCTGAAQAPFGYRVDGREWHLYSGGRDQRDDGGRGNLLRGDWRQKAGPGDLCFDSTELVTWPPAAGSGNRPAEPEPANREP